MNKKSLVVVIGFDPFQKKNGDSIRFFSWLNFLRDNDYQIELYIGGASSSLKGEHMFPVEYPDDFPIYFFKEKSSRFSAINKLRIHFRAIKHGAPPWIVANYSSSLHDQIRKIPISTPLILIGEAAGLYLCLEKSGSTLWDKSNVLTISTVSELRDSRSLFLRSRYFYHSILAKRFEKFRLSSQCWITATSGLEISRISQLSDNQNVYLLSSANGPYEPVQFNINSSNIGWIGSFNYAPNWRGLIRFLTVADHFLIDLGYKLKIMGADASSSQIAYLSRFKSINFVGYVDQIATGISDCKFLVVPLWSGAGIKIKSLDALKHGVPLLATTVGGEGIHQEAILHTFDDPSDLELFLSEIKPSVIEANLNLAKRVYLDNYSQEAFDKSLLSTMQAFILSCNKNY